MTLSEALRIYEQHDGSAENRDRFFEAARVIEHCVSRYIDEVGAGHVAAVMKHRAKYDGGLRELLGYPSED